MLWDFQGMEETFQISCYNDLFCHFNSNEYQFVDVQCILQLENFSSDSTICSVVRQAYGSMLGDDDGSNRFTILCYVTNNGENFKTLITGASEKLHTAALCSSSVGH